MHDRRRVRSGEEEAAIDRSEPKTPLPTCGIDPVDGVEVLEGNRAEPPGGDRTRAPATSQEGRTSPPDQGGSPGTGGPRLLWAPTSVNWR